MNPKTTKIIQWALAILVALIFIPSGIMKIMQTPEVIEGATKFGLDPKTFLYIGIVEIIAVILFIIPRTGVLGTLLLAAYLGGAIATHVLSKQGLMAPCVIQAFVWIVAIIRFPELKSRLFGK